MKRVAELREALEKTNLGRFERRVSATFRELGFQVTTGGLYKDPNSGKYREYDIRAEYKNSKLALRISTECKYIPKESLLVVECAQRPPHLAGHELIVWRELLNHSGLIPALVGGESSIYGRDQLFGVRLFDVKTSKAGTFEIEDNPKSEEQTLSQLNQVVSAASPVRNETAESALAKKGKVAEAMLSLLVVPKDSLWRVVFEKDIVRQLTPTKWISYFVGDAFCREVYGSFRPQYVEIICEDFLRKFLKDQMKISNRRGLFPATHFKNGKWIF